jgi:hypothetical protein
MPPPHRLPDHCAIRTTLDPVANSRQHRTHAENPEVVETEPDSTPDSKNRNRSCVNKSPLQNSNELRQFGAQTRYRIGLESKLPMPDPSPYKYKLYPTLLPPKP